MKRLNKPIVLHLLVIWKVQITVLNGELDGFELFELRTKSSE